MIDCKVEVGVKLILSSLSCSLWECFIIAMEFLTKTQFNKSKYVNGISPNMKCMSEMPDCLNTIDDVTSRRVFSCCWAFYVWNYKHRVWPLFRVICSPYPQDWDIRWPRAAVSTSNTSWTLFCYVKEWGFTFKTLSSTDHIYQQVSAYYVFLEMEMDLCFVSWMHYSIKHVPSKIDCDPG